MCLDKRVRAVCVAQNHSDDASRTRCDTRVFGEDTTTVSEKHVWIMRGWLENECNDRENGIRVVQATIE